MIRLDGAGRSFGRSIALARVDLAVRSGERVALVGPSGAGKTTLFRVLNLSIRLDRGSYALDGLATAGVRGRPLRAARSRVATIHQHHDVVGRLSVLKNILAGRLGRWNGARAARIFLAPPESLIEEARAVADRVGLRQKLFQRTDRLSGGERQRVAIARAIFQDARLILADEPVASLDPSRAEEILSLLVASSKQDGRTLIVSIHQPALAKRWFERVVGLKEGLVAFDLPAREVGDERLSILFAGVEDRDVRDVRDARDVRNTRDLRDLEEHEQKIARPACRPTDV